ncbi:MAG: T9SS type A sorting domain-containing protein [Chitinophagales bacterium]
MKCKCVFPPQSGPPGVSHICRNYLFLLILCVSGQMFAQAGQIKYVVQYVEECSAIHEISDTITAFSIPDRNALLPQFTRDSVLTIVYNNNTFKTTIWHLENSAYEDWMTRPAKTVIDKTQTKVYDADNHVLYAIPHSPVYKAQLNGLKNYLTTNNIKIVPVYDALNNVLKTAYIDSGFVYTNLGGGDQQFVKDSITVLFNNNLHANALRIDDADGNEKYYFRRGFAVNSIGQLTESYSIERKWDVHFPANCVRSTEIKRFIDYRLTTGIFREELAEDEQTDLQLTVSPNPASNTLHLEWNAEGAKTGVTVIDITGKQVVEWHTDAVTNTADLDIHDLENGLYFVRIAIDDNVCTQSFIKN